MVSVRYLTKSIIVPKKIVSTDSLIQIGRIETNFLERRVGGAPIKYQNLEHVFCEEDNTISLFWRCTWLLNLKGHCGWFYAHGTHRFTSWKVFCSIYAND